MSYELKKKDKKELDNLAKVIMTEADIVRQDYEENPSEMDSGSVVVVHHESTLLKDTKEQLSDIGYNIQPKSSSLGSYPQSVNSYGDDDWATPQEGEDNE